MNENTVRPKDPSICQVCGEDLGDEALCPTHDEYCIGYLDEHYHEHLCCPGLAVHYRCCRVCHLSPVSRWDPESGKDNAG